MEEYLRVVCCVCCVCIAMNIRLNEGRCLGSPQNTKGVYRSDMASWNDWLLDRCGFVQSGKITQSRGASFLRGLPVLRSAFARIWGVNIESEKDALVCSMDSVIAWRPWDGANHPWCPQTEGLHIDQNPHTKRDFCCVQGMLLSYDVTE